MPSKNKQEILDSFCKWIVECQFNIDWFKRDEHRYCSFIKVRKLGMPTWEIDTVRRNIINETINLTKKDLEKEKKDWKCIVDEYLRENIKEIDFNVYEKINKKKMCEYALLKTKDDIIDEFPSWPEDDGIGERPEHFKDLDQEYNWRMKEIDVVKKNWKKWIKPKKVEFL